MTTNIIDILRRIDLPTLQKLVGKVIYKAIQSVNKGQLEEEVAGILSLKYGDLILNQKDIRKATINTFTHTEANELAKICGLKNTSSIKAYNELIKYFDTSYNEHKSKILVDFLKLGSEYIFKRHIDIRTEKEVVTAKYGEEIKSLGFIHDYQKRVKDEVMLRLGQRTEKTFFLQMPTGAGKTLTALECVCDLLRKTPIKTPTERPDNTHFIVWLVDQNELAEQAFLSFKKLWQLRGDSPVNTFRLFKNFEPDFINEKEGVVFAGFDKFYSIIKKPTHRSYSSVNHLIKHTKLLIVDEAHHSIARTYFECISLFRNTPFIKIIGLSATPGSNNADVTKELVELYSMDKISIRDKNWNTVDDAIQHLQNEGYLAKLETQILETGITSNTSDDRLLNELASNDERNNKILEQIKLANDNNEATLVFACTLEHVYALLILCKYHDISANYIIGDVDQSERIGILEDFKSGKFNILINLDILSTGIDLPNVNKLIITRPINSPNLVSQIIGRALRGPKNGGNEKNIIINIKDNLINYPGASFLYNYFQEEWNKI